MAKPRISVKPSRKGRIEETVIVESIGVYSPILTDKTTASYMGGFGFGKVIKLPDTWRQTPETIKESIKRSLEIAHENGIATLYCDLCSNINDIVESRNLGRQIVIAVYEYAAENPEWQISFTLMMPRDTNMTVCRWYLDRLLKEIK